MNSKRKIFYMSVYNHKKFRIGTVAYKVSVRDGKSYIDIGYSLRHPHDCFVVKERVTTGGDVKKYKKALEYNGLMGMNFALNRLITSPILTHVNSNNENDIIMAVLLRLTKQDPKNHIPDTLRNFAKRKVKLLMRRQNNTDVVKDPV